MALSSKTRLPNVSETVFIVFTLSKIKKETAAVSGRGNPLRHRCLNMGAV
jgi:hypothetical protein